MREILFRAKTKVIAGDSYNSGKDDGEWVKGYVYDDIGICKIRQFETRCADYMSYEVDPDTVCQFTGLCDKNGKKIFDGDVLDCQDRIVKIVYNNECGTWDSIFIKYIGTLCSNGITPAEWKYRAEVIGNIHDKE